MKKRILYIATVALLTTACQERGQIASIEGGNIPVAGIDREGANRVKEIIEQGGNAVDSIKAPILGRAAATLTVAPPESSLMNFAADALHTEAERVSNEKIDIAITNKGGLRSELHEGEITFGDIYNIFPFENRLVLLTLNGEEVEQLLDEIAKAGGEPISGAEMTIATDGTSKKAIKTKVGNRAIDPKREYRIATSDYLAQGNDGLKTLAKGCNKREYSNTIRDLMVEHVKRAESEGKSINATVDGRIKIETTK